MNNIFMIIGSGINGLVAKEVADSMECFEKIGFVDDNEKWTPNVTEVIGKTSDRDTLSCEYVNAFVVIDDSEARISILQWIEEETTCRIMSFISPRAYESSSAQIMKGCNIEPMAVVRTGRVIETGFIIYAGAIVRHSSICSNGVHIVYNATVA